MLNGINQTTLRIGGIKLMEFHHPSYYKKLREKRKKEEQAQADNLNSENTERFIKNAQATTDQGQASASERSTTQTNARRRKRTSTSASER